MKTVEHCVGDGEKETSLVSDSSTADSSFAGGTDSNGGGGGAGYGDAWSDLDKEGMESAPHKHGAIPDSFHGAVKQGNEQVGTETEALMASHLGASKTAEKESGLTISSIRSDHDGEGHSSGSKLTTNARENCGSKTGPASVHENEKQAVFQAADDFVMLARGKIHANGALVAEEIETSQVGVEVTEGFSTLDPIKTGGINEKEGRKDGINGATDRFPDGTARFEPIPVHDSAGGFSELWARTGERSICDAVDDFSGVARPGAVETDGILKSEETANVEFGTVDAVTGGHSKQPGTTKTEGTLRMEEATAKVGDADSLESGSGGDVHDCANPLVASSRTVESEDASLGIPTRTISNKAEFVSASAADDHFSTTVDMDGGPVPKGGHHDDGPTVGCQNVDGDGPADQGEEWADSDSEASFTHGTLAAGASFDVELLWKSMEDGKVVLDTARDRHVVLVTGKTGTGKSTFVQGMNGRTLREAVHKRKNVYEAENALPGFEIGHAKESKTSCMRACVIDETVFVDTPGWHDNRGVEIDIATSVMTTQLVRTCKSLCFVVLISYVSLLEDRGGSARDVLKMVNSYVQDFARHKTSFMFLFTHTDDIHDIAEASLPQMRTVLMEELKRTIEGTVDVDQVAVLRHLARYLRKQKEEPNNAKYQIVDIFHPTRSNLGHIKKAVLHMPPLSVKYFSGSCGLTPLQQAKFDNEMQLLLVKLKHVLKTNGGAPEEAESILRMLRSFQHFIDIRVVRQALAEANSIVQRHLEIVFRAGEEKTARGTHDRCEFSDNDIQGIHLSITNLRCLENTFFGVTTKSDALRNYAEDVVRHLQKRVMEGCESGEELSEDLSGLMKLKRWSTFEDFAPLYQETCSHISALILDVCKNVQAHNGTNRLATTQEMKKLSLYHSKSALLGVHGVKSEPLEDAIGSTKKKIKATMKMLLAEDQKGSMQEKASFCHHLQILKTELGKTGVFAEVVEEATRFLDLMADWASKQVSVTCSSAAKAKANFGPSWENVLMNSSYNVSLFAGLQGSQWVKLQSDFADMLQVLKRVVEKKTSCLVSQAQETGRNGFKDGHSEKKMLLSTQAIQWFDDLLHPELRFVASQVEIAKRILEDRIRMVFAEAKRCICSLPETNPSAGAQRVSCLKLLLEELKKVQCFGEEYEEDVKLVHQQLLNHVLALKVHSAAAIEAFGAAKTKWRSEGFADKCGGMNEDLQDSVKKSGDDVLNTYDKSLKLFSMSERCDAALNEINESISQCMGEFSEEVKALVAQRGRYRAKMHALTIVEAFASSSAAKLLDIGGLRESARSGIELLAKEIEELLYQGKDWSKIDELTSVIENAKLIDKFTGSEASLRLRYLHGIREQKDRNAESEVQALLFARDFSAVKELLQSYSQARTPTRQEKLQKIEQTVALSLKRVVDEVNLQLGTNKATKTSMTCAYEGIHTLSSAGQSLGNVIGDLNIVQEKNRLKRKVNEILKTKLQDLIDAGKRSNFVCLSSCKAEVDSIVELFPAEQMPNFLKTLLRNGLDEYHQAVLLPDKHLVTFLSSCFSKGSEELLDVLESLKVCSDGEMMRVYGTLVKKLVKELNGQFRKLSTDVEDRHCFEEAIAWIVGLKRQMEVGLKNHVQAADLQFDPPCLLELWQENKKRRDEDLEFGEADAAEKLEKVSRLLGTLKNFFSLARWRSGFSYDALCKQLEAKVQHNFKEGVAALHSSDVASVQDRIDMLSLVSENVGTHVEMAAKKQAELKNLALNAFLALCDTAQKNLQSGGMKQFERSFPDFRAFVLNIPFALTSEDGKGQFAATNKLVFESLSHEISELKDLVKHSQDFRKIKEKIEVVRSVGSFVADTFTVLHQEILCASYGDVGRWLEEIFSLCVAHFGGGRHLRHIKQCAVLGVSPSAGVNEIEKSFEKLVSAAERKQGKHFFGARGSFVSVESASVAYQELQAVCQAPQPVAEQPFDHLVLALPDQLRDKAQLHLGQQEYMQVQELLFRLNSLHLLEDVVPEFDSQKSSQAIFELAKDHVRGVRVKVDSNWNEQMYKELNENIQDLKVMEESFKCYPDIFPECWNAGLLQKIETHIEDLGDRTRSYLKSKAMAHNKFADFRRCFVKMGLVLDELPLFQAHTKLAMSSVLETCLHSDWGYGFLFELGLSLQRGEVGAPENENRVGQMLVAEFSYFKEVQTLVWNEETCQKPAEDTVRSIRGERRIQGAVEDLHIDSNELLASFNTFEETYRRLLGQYLHADADINELVHKITKTAHGCLKNNSNFSCIGGWGPTIKQQLPTIVAGVFAVFTVLKSSDSYNRIENADLSEKILMKPHNIQVLTLLSMLGCGDHSESLENQVMEIRTGEGKSLIIGAAAVVLGLLGFQVRCVCYSEYLSSRDYNLFKDLFGYFQLDDVIVYSTITALSESNTKAKGDIRSLTEAMLGGTLNGRQSKPTSAGGEVIYVIDEFDKLFGPDFYGQTYNQVSQLRDPEVAEILQAVWAAHKQEGHRQKLQDIQKLDAYKTLLNRYRDHAYLLDNEIELMIDQVRRVDDDPYHLNASTNRIGYKIMDTIQYTVTHGYCTMFAYLKEADLGNLKNAGATLKQVLTMPVSCGQFSYANISPTRIVGVSGTVKAMGSYEKDVLANFGIERFVYVPSVYGQTNFRFDAAGDGIFVEASMSDYFHRITREILEVKQEGRASIVFFADSTHLKEYTGSAFYPQLGRQKQLLTEDMGMAEKDFVVKKAATVGQITLCTAVFGRGTDFFCKDEALQRNHGVHIIQTFLSEQLSEELQIKGRTARQGKDGSYQLILLESDLETNFGIAVGTKDRIPKEEQYEWLNGARADAHIRQCRLTEANLKYATEKDKRTHSYFDALLDGDVANARICFREIYDGMKSQSLAGKTDIDIAFLVDVTGSMGPYAQTIAATIKTLVDDQGMVMGRLEANFPDTEFTFRVAAMAFRDIDDSCQYNETSWSSASHFTEDVGKAISFVQVATRDPSGGGDLAEDLLGAIDRCQKWNEDGDWTSKIKIIMLLTDGPAHGLADSTSAGGNSDYHATRHPDGLTCAAVMGSLASKGIDLFFCSFNPAATAKTEAEFAKHYEGHKDNVEQRKITAIPLVPTAAAGNSASISYNRHIVFVLDHSGSMANDWTGVVDAYNNYTARRLRYQCDTDLVSVVQFAHAAAIAFQQVKIGTAPKRLYYGDGGTAFQPAAQAACSVARATPASHVPVVVFMSDGCANDSAAAASAFASLNNEVKGNTGKDLELHVIAFRSGASTDQLRQIANSSPVGTLRSSGDTKDLSKVFAEIAGGADVASVLEAEIARRVSEAVGDKIALEYLG